MKSNLQNFLNKYIYSDKLPFDAKVFNIVCIAGIFALLASIFAHIIEGFTWQLMGLKAVMIFSVILLLFISNRFKIHHIGAILAVFGFCDIMFPMLFFLNGGANSGIAAYFVLSIIIITLLSKGIEFIVFIITHLTIIVFCYLLERIHPELIIQLTEEQIHMDSVFSTIIAGLFIAITVKALSRLFIIERKKAEVAGKAKGDFLAQMSHEMRTPLNAIIGMTSILEGTHELPRYQTGLSKINVASHHLLGVINDILDMSKIETGKLELYEENFSLHTMIENVSAIIRVNAEGKSQDFTVSIAPDIPPYLWGDSQRLAQAVANLLSNAVKFTPIGGSVALDVIKEDEDASSCAIRISVTDTGIGITKEQMKRLFNVFEQADNSTSRHFGGTGLGLAISKNIVDMIGGELTVTSEPDEGSQFLIRTRLPKGQAPEVEMTLDETRQVETFEGKRILIAEDIDINREIITALLEPTGMIIECANNGREAVETYKESKGAYDMILMDIQMPEMDGYEATRSIRASGIAGAKTVPILALTANVFKSDIDLARTAGMNDHLCKPIELRQVFAKLHHYLYRSEDC